ncbi:MAG TPA: branched-chain amino acid ABC transporter permease [Ktedonobacteraceae bacterium]|jgi:branched-chain amino acid transport system permease protein|nr:branched-chain amino acid ABC transporter permease [Ktedonobacteraceae bacterium]
MKLILEAVVNGLLMGGVYALMASGLTLVYGVMEVVNIAQGIFVVAGAYLSYTLQQRLHLDLFLGLLVTVPIMFVLGLFIEWAMLRRLKRDRIVLSVLVTFALTLVIEGVLGLIYGASLVYLHAWYISNSFQIFGFYISYIYVFAFLLSTLLLGALYLLVYRTTFGFSLRASMQNRAAALLVGIDVEQVQAITFGIGVSLAAAGGMAFGATNVFNANSSFDLITRLLVIIVLGGMGSLWGALIASLLMLVIGDVTAVVWSPIWSNTMFFVLLIALLLARPQGLFGQREGRKQ